jgi:endo-1,4-beta-xylanase
VFAACFRHPNCVGYTTWGVDDRYDWWIDDDGEPTAPYDAIRRVLEH